MPCKHTMVAPGTLLAKSFPEHMFGKKLWAAIEFYAKFNRRVAVAVAKQMPTSHFLVSARIMMRCALNSALGT